MNIEEKISRGFELLQDKDIDHSLDLAREIQKEAPDTPEGYYLEALIMQQLNQLDLSLSSIEKALERSENNGVYLNLRGQIHMIKEDLEAAEADFDAAIEANDVSAAHRNKVMIMLMTDRGSDAVAYLINRIKAEPRDAENWILMGDMIMKGGQGDKARTYYEQALKIDPDNEYAQRQLEEMG
jgi:Tfp pilus assembly protein PilF